MRLTERERDRWKTKNGRELAGSRSARAGGGGGGRARRESERGGSTWGRPEI